MDYKDTLHLPKTDFPMRGNLTVREPEILAKWEETQAYEALRQMRKGRKKFILHDGPPYSNGHIHMGTAVNKIIKDFIVRSYSMLGYDTPYVPGWDNHGMPIENNVTKEMAKHHKDLAAVSKVEIRKKCREYAEHFIAVQRTEFMRLGGWGDWYNPYLTMSPDFEAKIVSVFGELVEKGYIYRGLKPIHWCITDTCATALAEAEIEYEEKTSDSIVVRFPLVNDPNGIFADCDHEKCHVLIWTTTPWTIPANLAVVVHPDYDYSLIKTNAGDVYLLATKLIGPVMEMIEQDGVDEIKRLMGHELKDLVFKHPLFERVSPLFFADYVTLEDGTGVVHTAPGHGKEDFDTGLREGMPILCPVNERGYFTQEAHHYEGTRVFDGNQVVVEDLRANGALLHHSRFRHSYPHCWRCHQPLIFRAATQWFMSIDHNDLRQRSIAEIDHVRWLPHGTINRIKAMVENRPDWCLSRQRTWGVGIPVFYCTDCQESILSKEAVDYVVKLVKKEGSDAWFEVPPEKILPADFVCPKCGCHNFRKETDILDVWFDSGSTHRAVLEDNLQLEWPCDVYFEGSDQHRGWFNSSLMVAVGTKNAAPYRQVITHGWLVDEKGKAMHKSRGNAVSPLKVIEQYGADMLRLWTASTDFRVDMSYSEKNMKRVADAYRRIRNTFRFALGNLNDFDPNTHAVKKADMPEFDRWVMHRLEKLIGQLTRKYTNYEYHEIYQDIHNFCAVDMSALYLDIVKDRLYCDGTDSISRRSAQTVLYYATRTLLTYVAPILVFTAEDAWQYFPRYQDDPVSVHHLQFTDYQGEFIDAKLGATWDQLLAVRQEVTRVLEDARYEKEIGHSLDAAVYLFPKTTEMKSLLENYIDDLPMFFITSQVSLMNESGEVDSEFTLDTDTLQVVARTAAGEKCNRCWQFDTTVGDFEDHPAVCVRCHRVLSGGNE